MPKEVVFFEGVSRAFQVCTNETAIISLQLQEVCTTPCIGFSGRILDGCHLCFLEGVYVAIRYGTCEKFAYTDKRGRFCFKLPDTLDSVDLCFCRHGYGKQYMNKCPIGHERDQPFFLYPMDI